MNLTGSCLLACIIACFSGPNVAAQPSIDSGEMREATRDSRMQSWRDRRLGLFIHWGPYSKLAGSYDGKKFSGNAEWIMKGLEISKNDYREVAKTFDPKNYDPEAIVALAKSSGFRYIILTAKHYDGFALFKSEVTDFDSVNVLPSKRDLLKEFADACEKQNMPLGFSYSLNDDWYHLDRSDWARNRTETHVKYLESIALTQVRELTRNYGNVAIMMFDQGPPLNELVAEKFQREMGGGIVTSFAFSNKSTRDYLYSDRGRLGTFDSRFDWERARSAHDSWGYREGGKWAAPDELLKDMILTAGGGGNYLLNVGLDGEGQFPPEAVERFGVLSRWLGVHGKSIFGTSKSVFRTHTWEGTSTSRDAGENGFFVYLHIFNQDLDRLTLPQLLSRPATARLLGDDAEIQVEGYPANWDLNLSNLTLKETVSVIELEFPSRPTFGSGPIAINDSEPCELLMGRCETSGSSIKIERTPSSPLLQLKDMVDSNQVAMWSVYSAQQRSIRAVVEAAPGTERSARFTVTVNQGKTIEFGGEKNSEEKFRGGPICFVSQPFILPAGEGTILLSRPADEENQNPVNISKVLLEPDTN